MEKHNTTRAEAKNSLENEFLDLIYNAETFTEKELRELVVVLVDRTIKLGEGEKNS